MDEVGMKRVLQNEFQSPKERALLFENIFEIFKKNFLFSSEENLRMKNYNT